jgi:hypothetical protein
MEHLVDAQHIKQKIKELSEEASIIVSKKQDLFNKIKDIDIRLAQIAGAIEALDSLVK